MKPELFVCLSNSLQVLQNSAMNVVLHTYEKHPSFAQSVAPSGLVCSVPKDT